MIPKKRFLFFCCCLFLCGCIIGSMTGSFVSAYYLSSAVHQVKLLISEKPILCAAVWELSLPTILFLLSSSTVGRFLVLPADAIWGFIYGYAMFAIFHADGSYKAFIWALFLGIPTVPYSLFLSTNTIWLSSAMARANCSGRCMRNDYFVRHKIAWSCYGIEFLAFILRVCIFHRLLL